MLSFHLFSAVKSLNYLKIKVRTEFPNVWREYILFCMTRISIQRKVDFLFLCVFVVARSLFLRWEFAYGHKMKGNFKMEARVSCDYHKVW